MKFKKYILITFVLITIACLSAVSASDVFTNGTDDIDGNSEKLSVNAEHSVCDEKLAKNQYANNSDNEKLSQVNKDNLSSGGKFIDVNDAYVYLNQFRTEKGVWQWNGDDSTKTFFNTGGSNQLKPLARDLNLEKTAKIRAKEIAKSFSHIRPDGTICFTAFPDDLLESGENIAYGQSSCREVIDDWKESKQPYSGQGHRRNMLNDNYNAVGIAGYKVNGRIYWVQVFGYTNNIKEGTIKTITKITAKKKTFKAKTKTKKYSITLKNGKKAVKKVKVYLKIKGKTFKATTNKYGKAIFKIKLYKKGTFKTKITFKGNKNHKSTTKIVKIKIKYSFFGKVYTL